MFSLFFINLKAMKNMSLPNTSLDGISKFSTHALMLVGSSGESPEFKLNFLRTWSNWDESLIIALILLSPFHLSSFSHFLLQNMFFELSFLSQYDSLSSQSHYHYHHAYYLFIHWVLHLALNTTAKKKDYVGSMTLSKMILNLLCSQHRGKSKLSTIVLKHRLRKVIILRRFSWK